MSTQADYTPDEWNVLVHAPALASVYIINADKSGGIQGQFGLIQEAKDARATVETAASTGSTELVRGTAGALLQEQSWKPLLKGATPESVTTSLQRATEIVDTKAAPPEAKSFKQYVYDVAKRTASAAKESGTTQTSPKEAVALEQIAGLLHLNG